MKKNNVRERFFLNTSVKFQLTDEEEPDDSTPTNRTISSEAFTEISSHCNFFSLQDCMNGSLMMMI